MVKPRKKKSPSGPPVLDPSLVAALKFDKYIASVPTATLEQLAALVPDGGVRLKEVKKTSRTAIAHRFHFYDERGKKAVTVWRKEGHPTIEVKGDATPVIVERLRLGHKHFVWKSDVCLDTGGGKPEYDEIVAAIHEVQEADSRVHVDARGDPKHPERGYRCYLGMQDSPGSALVYQKGLQQGFRRLNMPGWNRTEWRLVVDKEHRDLASTLSPLDTIRLNATTAKLANILLGLELAPLAKTPSSRKKCLDTLDYVCEKFPRSFRLAGIELGGTDIVLAKIGFSIDGQHWVCVPEKIYAMNRTGGTDVHRLWPSLKTMVEKSRQCNDVDVDFPAVRVLRLESDDVRMEPYMMDS